MDNNNIFHRLLTELFLSMGQLAERVPLGGDDYMRMLCEFYTERVFNQLRNEYNPASNKAVDLCEALIELMDNNEIVNKEDYKVSGQGETVNIKINKSNCTYYNYCKVSKENNLPTACCRMISCRWIASGYTGLQYQLSTEYNDDLDWCEGTIYPGEKISETLYKEGENIYIAGERALVISINTHGILLKTIYDYAPHLLEQVLYESTYYSSLVEYDKVKIYYKDSRALIDHLLNISNRLGSIQYEIIEFDDKNKTAVLRGYGSYMADVFLKNNLFNSPKASCASAKGRLSAYFTKAWEEEIVCEEMKCEAFGDDYCEFVLQPKDY